MSFITEKQIKAGLITTTGFLVTLVAIIVYFMWFVIGTLETGIYGTGGLVLILVFTVAAIRYFYNKRSSGMELVVEGLATAGAITILMIVEPTSSYPGLPIFFKKLLCLTLYLVLVTFATQFLKPEMIEDPREKAFVRGIQASAGIVVGVTVLWLTFRWYVYSLQGFGALLGCLILTGLTIAFFKDDISDDLQVGIELFTLIGVPCLILWAKPNPAVDPGYDWLKKTILAVLYLVVVSFSLMFIELQEPGKKAGSAKKTDGEEDSTDDEKKTGGKEDSTEEDAEPEMADPGVLKKGEYFYHDGIKHEVLKDVDAGTGEDCSVSATNCRTGKKVIFNFSPDDKVEMATKESPVILQ